MSASKYYLGGSASSTKHAYFQPASLSVSQVIAANGGPIYSITGSPCASVTEGDDPSMVTTIITLSSGTFGVEIPSLSFVRLEFAAADHYKDGWYQISFDGGAASEDNHIHVDMDFVDLENVTAIYVGGSRPANHTEWIAIFTSNTVEYYDVNQDNKTLDWTSNKVDIYVNDFGSDIDVTTTWDITNRTGSINNFVDVWACDGANNPDTWTHALNGTTLTTTTVNLTTGIIRYNATADTLWYHNLHYFEIDGNNDNADYGICPSSSASSDDQYILLENITIHNCAVAGFSIRGLSSAGWVRLLNCVSYSNSGIGFTEATTSRGASMIIGCIAHDNSGNGFQINMPYANYIGCLSYRNAKGFSMGANADVVSLIGCISDGNSDDGFDCASGTTYLSCAGCVSTNNAAKGFDFDGPGIILFKNNCYYNGSGNDLNGISVLDSEFPDWGQGGNIVDNPLFVDRANGDFSVQYNSPLLPTGSTNTFIHKIPIGMVPHIPDYRNEHLQLIRDVLEADTYIDTDTTPWQFVYVSKDYPNPSDEIMRFDLLDVDGNNISNDTTAIGQMINIDVATSIAETNSPVENIEFIKDFVAGDKYIDTAKMPWELVVRNKDNPSDELMRKVLYDVNGNNLSAANTVIGQMR